MVRKARAGAKPDAFADALNVRCAQGFSAGIRVEVGHYLNSDTQLPTVALSNESPIEFPSPNETQVKSVLLEFVNNPIARFANPKHTYLRFTATDDSWKIERAECTPLASNPNPAPNFDIAYAVNLKGPDIFLKYGGLKGISLEMKAPKVDGGSRVEGVVPLGGKPIQTPAAGKPHRTP